MKRIMVMIVIALLVLVAAVSAQPRPLQDPAPVAINEVRRDISSLRDMEQLRSMTKEEFQAAYQAGLESALARCDETDDPEACKLRIRERAENVKKLSAEAVTKIQSIEKRQLVKTLDLKNLATDPRWDKYKDGKARDIAQQKLEEAKKAYTRAKEKYANAKQNYDDAKGNFDAAKKRLQECSGDECAEIEAEIRTRAKEFLANTGANILEHIGKVKANVEMNEDLSEEEATEILADLGEMESEINDALATIESSEDKEEITEAAKTIKKAWLSIQKRLRVHTGMMVNARIGGVVVQIKQLDVRLERTLARMEEQGISTADIQEMVDGFSEKTALAQLKYEQALDKFEDAKAESDPKLAHDIAAEGHALMKEAHDALQEAQKLLRDIVQEINNAGGSAALDAPEDEAEMGDDDEAQDEDESDDGSDDDSGDGSDDESDDGSDDDSGDGSDDESDDALDDGSDEDSDDDSDDVPDNETDDSLGDYDQDEDPKDPEENGQDDPGNEYDVDEHLE